MGVVARGEDEDVERSFSLMKMATERITLILHHKGFLGRQEGVLRYIGGEFCVWEGFEKIYWLKPGRDLEVGLRELENDAHVVNMCNATRKNAGEIEIFFIHPIEQTPPVCRPSCPPVESPLQTPVNSPIHMMSDDSDDYESVEDSAYKPSPIVSEDDDMDDSVVKKSEIKSKTTPVKRKIGATSNDNGKRVVADASDEDEIFIEEEIDVGSNVGNGEGDDISEDEVEEVDEGVPQKPKKWTPPATDIPQTGQEEVNLSQGVPSVDPQDSQQPPTEGQAQSVIQATATAQANLVLLNLLKPRVLLLRLQPPTLLLLKPILLLKGLLKLDTHLWPKLNTMRPPIVGAVVPPQATQPQSVNNSSTQQLPGQPSQGTINAASQGTRERLMKFIPTPRGPSTKPK
ncbi:hypothetical protein SESBI_10969 [Sesbania bispinosa]|nr:hypothetical protein SESBI_10969 [Sesbania bispinosa]